MTEKGDWEPSVSRQWRWIDGDERRHRWEEWDGESTLAVDQQQSRCVAGSKKRRGGRR